MSIDNINIIDIVSIEKEGNVVLTVADHLEWDTENFHLLKLQNKLNAYLLAIENGSLWESYPNGKNRKVIINVCLKYLPNDVGNAFLHKTKKNIENMGYGFSHSLINSS